MLSGAVFDMDGLMFDTERVYRDTWVRLADLYGWDDRFAEHMDSYGPGTAHYMSEAILAYLEDK